MTSGRPGAPAGKLLLMLLLALTPLLRPTTAGAADDWTPPTDVVQAQEEISRDIAQRQAAVEAELGDGKLTSIDIAARMKQLDGLAATASEDAAGWGFSAEQREQYARLLSDLSMDWSAYGSMLQSQPPRAADASELPASQDLAAAADVDFSDGLLMRIQKATNELDVQMFYLQSKLGVLKLSQSDIESLEGGARADDGSPTPPQLQELKLELARVRMAASWAQVLAAKQICDANVALIRDMRAQLASVKGRLTFPEALLNAHIASLDREIDETAAQLENGRGMLLSAASDLTKAYAAMKSADVLPLTAASSRYLERKTNTNKLEYSATFLEDKVRCLREAQDLWRKRYKLFHDQASGQDIWQYRSDARSRMAELERQLEAIQLMKSELQRSIATMTEQAEGTDGRTRQNLGQALQNAKDTVANVLNLYSSLIPNQIFLLQTFYDEASEKLNAVRIAEKVGSFGKATVMGFLNTKLWEGEGYAVTVVKLITALLVFVSSFFLSAWGSRWIQRWILYSLPSKTTAAGAAQRIVFYVLWFAFVLIALQIVNIPLTAFAFLGGAIAVAIGFGAQNLFNNLISGFILIFSRPFKVGDIIEVDGTNGIVEDIGSRSTRIRTWESFDVIVPNRYLLENRVTNWTGSDVKKREVLKVQVAYGTDTRRVEELLMKVIRDHSKALKDPAPFVLFRDFGAGSLEFEMYYWVDLTAASTMKVASDMRHHIASLFRQEGIEIPFPRTDVYLVPPVGGSETQGTLDP